MKILAIDTSTRFLCLGLSEGKRIYEYKLELGTKHSALLIPTIKRALDALGWRMPDIDYFACGLGPGSFTGIRIGVATIKGLSWAMGKPALGVPTLDILAQNIKDVEGDIAVALDAKRGLIYCGIYRKKKDKISRLRPYMLLSCQEFFKAVKPGSIILGDAAGLYHQEMAKYIKGVNILDKDSWYPLPYNIITLAMAGIKDKKAASSATLKPIYLYPKECQIKTVGK
ncbi:MAG: tRNA (adenosine(37)-N6)-threonylcarbamoyltransferase complex dimerization subunit type 1 TsaB [Candidatus Omnitrophica bacterium]|nr:tRNA (adenosine(37)-N6)-threonylcarbamoyltransferase complex dimerization subunit type 1 TsaB [Candidatus Omnitrophota bacterium]